MGTWTKTTLLQLISNQIEESINLEYKAAEALQDKKEIAKDVSAFANSDGGTIIYGIKEFNDRSKKHLPEAIDPILDIKKYSKEWVEQVINSNIEPRILGITITPIRLNKHSHESVYIIEVPKSDTAHMTDFRYFRRFNFQSVMTHDYEIRDIMNRKLHPKIQISFASSNDITLPMNVQNTNYIMKVFAENIGGIMAKYIYINIFVPEQFVDIQRLESSKTTDRNNTRYFVFEFDNTKKDGTTSQIVNKSKLAQFGPPRYYPILPGMKIEVGKFPCINNAANKDIKLFVLIHVDNAQPIEIEYKLANYDLIEKR